MSVRETLQAKMNCQQSSGAQRLIIPGKIYPIKRNLFVLREVSADTSARDGVARHVFVVGTGSGVLGWVTDQSTVLVALGILKGTGWGGNGAWADVGRASTLGVAFWGTHGTFNASDGDVDFTGLASGRLEWVFEVACGSFAEKQRKDSQWKKLLAFQLKEKPNYFSGGDNRLTVQRELLGRGSL